MEKINYKNKISLDSSFVKVESIKPEKEIDINFNDSGEYETTETEYIINILYLGSSLVGKTYIINKLVEKIENNSKSDINKINIDLYKRTLGLDKRIQKIIYDNKNITVRFFELGSNINFDRLYDGYLDFLEEFDLIFLIVNKEINWGENLSFLQSFKDSLKDSRILNSNNYKNFLEKKFYIVSSRLNFMESEKNTIRNRQRISMNNVSKKNPEKENKFRNYSSNKDEDEHLDWEINLNNSLNKNKEEKSVNDFVKINLNFLIFDINKISEFKEKFQEILDEKLEDKINEEIYNDVANKVNKDVFDLSNKFFFDKIRKKKKKKYTC